MSQTADDVLKLINDKEAKFVDLRFELGNRLFEFEKLQIHNQSTAGAGAPALYRISLPGA